MHFGCAQLQRAANGHPGKGLATLGGKPGIGINLAARPLSNLGTLRRYVEQLLALTLALAFVLPEEVPTLPFAIGQLLGMVMLAKHLTEADIQQHAAAGGTFLSNWRAAGIAVLFSIAVMALLFAVLMILDV